MQYAVRYQKKCCQFKETISLSRKYSSILLRATFLTMKENILSFKSNISEWEEPDHEVKCVATFGKFQLKIKSPSLAFLKANHQIKNKPWDQVLRKV